MTTIKDDEGNTLTIGETQRRYYLVWVCDGDEGATIDRAATIPADAIEAAAHHVLRAMVDRGEIDQPNRTGKTYYFETEKLARRALAEIKARLDSQVVVLPEWAQAALAEHWTPPRGWMAKQPRKAKT